MARRPGPPPPGQDEQGNPVQVPAPKSRYLTLAEREEIAIGLASGLDQAEIARRIERNPGTVSREIRRNRQAGRRGQYRAVLAQQKADERAARPKVRKIDRVEALREHVQDKLKDRWSPEQISADLRQNHPDDRDMQVSPEAIYQALYVQGKGGLRRELAKCLRTGRALRKPRRRPNARGPRIKDKVMISERPAEVADRAVPGHWEGDLIIGAHQASAIGTLVERTTRYVMLLHLPNGHDAEAVAEAMITAMSALPQTLRRTLTWDQGVEMAAHAKITMATDMDIYFCDPASPWQRGSNENTNGLLRQYFPKGTDLSVHSAGHLAHVADELNTRPRKTLGWKTPDKALNELLASAPKPPGVATTG
ncbi:MAG: IS30 family transposase [Motilibacteraceae bacterium]